MPWRGRAGFRGRIGAASVGPGSVGGAKTSVAGASAKTSLGQT